MLEEITAAVAFLIRLIEKSTKMSKEQLQVFNKELTELLLERFKNHWFPDQPSKGQGYRCIRVNTSNRRDATLEQAATACGYKYEDLNLPVELTLWVDPNEVCCRFGEHRGSYCTLASFSGKENKNSLDVEEIGIGPETSKEVKTEIIPLSASANGVNKIRRSVNLEVSEQNSRNTAFHGHMEWNNQGHLNGGFPPHSLHSWYTLIPQWLPPSPPPLPPPLPLPPVQFDHGTSTLEKWNNQSGPNYHHYHRV